MGGGGGALEKPCAIHRPPFPFSELNPEGAAPGRLRSAAAPARARLGAGLRPSGSGVPGPGRAEPGQSYRARGEPWGRRAGSGGSPDFMRITGRRWDTRRLRALPPPRRPRLSFLSLSGGDKERE